MDQAAQFKTWIDQQLLSEHGIRRLTILQLIASIIGEEVTWIQEKIGHYYSNSKWIGRQGSPQYRIVTYQSIMTRLLHALDDRIPAPIRDAHTSIVDMFASTSVTATSMLDDSDNPSDTVQASPVTDNGTQTAPMTSTKTRSQRGLMCRETTRTTKSGEKASTQEEADESPSTSVQHHHPGPR